MTKIEFKLTWVDEHNRSWHSADALRWYSVEAYGSVRYVHDEIKGGRWEDDYNRRYLSCFAAMNDFNVQETI